jgi:hypothetical protein
MKRFFLGCLGVGILLLMCISVMFWFWLLRVKPLLDAELSFPPEVVVNRNFPLTVTVSNPHDEAVVLDSIDVDDSLLKGFQVIRVEPAPSESFHLSILDQRSWSFGTEVKPGDSMTVSFLLKPLSPGHFSGDLDVCNPNQDFKTLMVDLVVGAASP